MQSAMTYHFVIIAVYVIVFIIKKCEILAGEKVKSPGAYTQKRRRTKSGQSAKSSTSRSGLIFGNARDKCKVRNSCGDLFCSAEHCD